MWREKPTKHAAMKSFQRNSSNPIPASFFIFQKWMTEKASYCDTLSSQIALRYAQKLAKDTQVLLPSFRSEKTVVFRGMTGEKNLQRHKKVSKKPRRY